MTTQSNRGKQMMGSTAHTLFTADTTQIPSTGAGGDGEEEVTVLRCSCSETSFNDPYNEKTEKKPMNMMTFNH